MNRRPHATVGPCQVKKVIRETTNISSKQREVAGIDCNTRLTHQVVGRRHVREELSGSGGPVDRGENSLLGFCARNRRVLIAPGRRPFASAAPPRYKLAP